eukprot:scaffold362_cov246-Pinguiococcus_pyrenoidosus.AAC.1
MILYNSQSPTNEKVVASTVVFSRHFPSLPPQSPPLTPHSPQRLRPSCGQHVRDGEGARVRALPPAALGAG